jgi:hypothetical protein
MRKIQDGQTQEVTSCICLPLEHHGEPSSTSNKSAMGFSTTPAMSASTLPSTTTIPSIVSILISKKLMKTNYPLWSTQVLPPIRAVQLEGLLIGDEKSQRRRSQRSSMRSLFKNQTLPMCYGLPETKPSSSFFSHRSCVRPLCMSLAARPRYKHGVP